MFCIIILKIDKHCFFHSHTGNNSTEQKNKDRVTWNSHMMKSMSSSTRFGQSLHGTNLSTLMTNKRYGIVVGIEITNWTKYHLTEPKTKTYSGYISTPAVSIGPGHKDAMVNIYHVLFRWSSIVIAISTNVQMYHLPFHNWCYDMSAHACFFCFMSKKYTKTPASNLHWKFLLPSLIRGLFEYDLKNYYSITKNIGYFSWASWHSHWQP